MWRRATLFLVLGALASGAGIGLVLGMPWLFAGPANVVLVSLDTTRADHLGAYGYGKATSPHVDELAREGVVFEDAIAAHTNTAPSHATLLSGLPPRRHGVLRNGYRLAPGVVTLAEILQDGGYATAAFVSGWTLSRHVRLNRGFERYDDRMGRLGRRDAAATLEAALPWLREVAAAGRPFFLFFHLFDPHYPYDPPAEWGRRFLDDGRTDFTTTLERAPGLASEWNMKPAEYAEVVSRYDGEIAYADHHLGLLLDELAALGVLDESLVILVSDHGETLLERAWIFDHGGRVYDEQIRVPFIVRLPFGRHGGARVAGQVTHLDLLPTVLDVLEIRPPAQLPGRSLLPYIRGIGQPEPTRLAFSQAEPHPRRVPQLDAPPLSKQGLVTAVRTLDRKLIEYPTEDGGYRYELFDLAADPGERRDLSAERPGETARWSEVLRMKRSEAGPDAPRQDLPEEVRRGLEALGYGTTDELR